MIIWIVSLSEPKPFPGTSPRLLRCGQLADFLARNGHNVHWWSSSFDHARKTHLTNQRVFTYAASNITVTLLRGKTYRHHISPSRIINHIQVAQLFLSQSASFEKPDVIFVSWPSIELAGASVYYGTRNNVPTIIDIRDLWPDIFIESTPAQLRPIAKLALLPYSLASNFILSKAHGLSAITQPFLQWALDRASRSQRSSDIVIHHPYKPSANASIPHSLNIVNWTNQLGIDNNHCVFVFFGTFSKQFDFDTIINGTLSLPQSLSDRIRIVFCGDGETRLDTIAKCSKHPNFIFPGWCNQDQIAHLLTIAKAGIAPYKNRYDFNNSYPNKIIEYLSAGLPIISCLNGLVSTLIQKESIGFTYPEGDHVEFCKCLSNAMDSDCMSMKERCNQVFRARFSATTIIPTLANHLLQVAHNHKHQRMTNVV